MSDVAIHVEGLGKQYRIGGPVEKYRTIRDSISGLVAAPARRIQNIMRGRAPSSARNDTTIWALRDLSFTVKHGEVLGIIGHNGAGKSTLLKILSRITEPTEGRAVVYGRLGALLEVGTGFHPELTGRENIFLNAAILGMSRREIESKLDEIVAFAEVEKYIDTPVKQYSSGMALRLGFSVAAHLEPEILVIDEVLAVGDLAFQRKCLGKMGEVSQQGRTVLFVSHNMAAITNLTQRSILLSQGNIIFDGDTSDAIAQYIKVSNTQDQRISRQRLRLVNGFTLEGIRFENKEGESVSAVPINSSLNIYVDYSVNEPTNVSFVITFVNMFGTRAFSVSNRHVQGQEFRVTSNGTVCCAIEKLQLVPGRYHIRLAIYSNRKQIYLNEQTASIDVIDGDIFGTSFVPKPGHGVYVQDSKWQVTEAGFQSV